MQKIYYGKGITKTEKMLIKKWLATGQSGNQDTHFWKSDGRIKFQQLVGKEYFGNIYEFANLKEGKLRQVM